MTKFIRFCAVLFLSYIVYKATGSIVLGVLAYPIYYVVMEFLIGLLEGVAEEVNADQQLTCHKG